MLLKSSHLQPPHFSFLSNNLSDSKSGKIRCFPPFLTLCYPHLYLSMVWSQTFLYLIEGPTKKYIRRSVTLHSCVQRNNVSGLLSYEVLVL